MDRGRRARVALSSSLLAATLLVPIAPATVLATDGLFQPFVAVPIPSEADAVAIGDVTGDGRADVVVTTGYSGDPDVDFHLLVLRQGADGLLEAPVLYDTAGTYSARPGSVDIGDIDGDGLADVVVGIDRVGIEVFPGLPEGTLGAPTLSPHSNSTRIRVGQLHPLGGLDVAGIGWGSDSVTVFVDPGGGLDGFATYPAVHNGYDDLEIGDLNGDGNEDLVVMSGQGVGPNISILHGQASGAFLPAVELSIYQMNVHTSGIGVGDTNGDGLDDLAASFGGNSPDSRMALWIQLADGSLDMPVIHNSYDIPGAVAVADLDLDGKADVVTLHDGWLQAGVYLGRNGGYLDDEQLYPIPYASNYNPHGLAVGDVNADGWPDVVAADYINGLVILSNGAVYQPTEPDAPTLTSAVAWDGTVTLAWTPPANDGGSPLTNYLVEASPTGGYCFVSATSCTISGLTNGETYSFTVRAGNAVGLGPPSNAVSATPGVTPTAPRSLAASPNLPAGVGLTWQAPSSLGSPTMTGYRIYRGTPGGNLGLHATVNANAVSFTDTAVTNGGSYAYQVAAFNSFGEGPRAPILSAQRGTAPSAPRSVTATSGKGITLKWTAPLSNGGSAVTAYRIYRSTSSGSETFLVSVSGSTLTYVDKAVTKKVKYFYWIAALNNLGEGVHSTEVSATAR